MGDGEICVAAFGSRADTAGAGADVVGVGEAGWRSRIGPPVAPDWDSMLVVCAPLGVTAIKPAATNNDAASAWNCHGALRLGAKSMQSVS